MDAGSDIAGTALTALQNQPLAAMSKFASGANQTGTSKTDAQIDKASKDFESVFISQFLGSMFAGIKTDGIGGGGQGEEMFRSLMIDQYAQGLTSHGGFGLATSVKAQMIKMQEGRP